MSELEKLKDWMSKKNLSVPQLAREMGIPYINAFMCIEKRKRLSPTFELQFRHRFGKEVADEIFDPPVVVEKVPA